MRTAANNKLLQYLVVKAVVIVVVENSSRNSSRSSARDGTKALAEHQLTRGALYHCDLESGWSWKDRRPDVQESNEARLTVRVQRASV